MNLYGRYLLALVWLRKLCGTDVSENRYRPLSACGVEKVDRELLAVLRTLAQKGVTP